VLSTILAAIDLGYRIIVVKDGLCSSADQTHDALLGLYGQRFDLQVELTQANELLEVWARIVNLGINHNLRHVALGRESSNRFLTPCRTISSMLSQRNQLAITGFSISPDRSRKSQAI